MQRAIAIEDKAERRLQILRAADTLLDIRRHALPSVAEIARASGLAKGTPYLYFRTKEEIYLAVLAEGAAVWVDVLRAALRTENPSIDMILGRYVRFCVKNPKIIFLSAMAALILERNVSPAAAYAFKKGVADQIAEIAGLLVHAFPGLAPDAAGQLFLNTYALTTGLWQHAHPPPVVQKVYEREDLDVMKLDYQSHLYNALHALWRGSIR